MRSLLAAHPDITPTFEDETKRYIHDVVLPKEQSKALVLDAEGLKTTQKTIRCMQGCGMSTDSIELISNLAIQALELPKYELSEGFLASIDGDCVQLVTALEKGLLAAGLTTLLVKEQKLVGSLRQSLIECWDTTKTRGVDYPYVRALTATSILLGAPVPELDDVSPSTPHDLQLNLMEMRETFHLNGRTLPRIFSGLWQMSSPSWGSAPTSKITAQFAKYVSAGMVAFDMADHYGDAELLFVSQAKACKALIFANMDRAVSTQHIQRRT